MLVQLGDDRAFWGILCGFGGIWGAKPAGDAPAQLLELVAEVFESGFEVVET